jgi:hypothetical protein
MPLKKLVFKAGVNRENTRYTTEGGYYDGDKIRFRQGTPEKIGGWQRISQYSYLGVCRALWNWITLENLNLVSVGTNLKYYIERGGVYNDITPLRYQTLTNDTLNNPFDTVDGSTTVTVNAVGSALQTGDAVAISNVITDVEGIPYLEFDTYFSITRISDDAFTIILPTAANATATGVGGAGIVITYISNTVELTDPFDTVDESAIVTVTQVDHGAEINDFVTFFGGTAVGGLDLNGTFQVTAVISTSEYQITANSAATSTATGGGTVYAQYEINTGPEFVVPLTGWGAGPWGFGSWGNGQAATDALRLWSQANFGEDLVFGPRGGAIYYWKASNGVDTIGYDLSLTTGALDVPVVQNYVFISDIYRFVFAFGCNDYTSTVQDPMLIRWSDQEVVNDWTPSATNQAGSLRLSHGSEIVTAIQTRQEVFVLTDSACYGMQYLGPPYVWNATLLADNTSIVGQNAAALASGVVFWMGVDKFYKYDGRVQTLRCDLRQFIFNDFNATQSGQVYASTNEGFNEVWWFYPTANSTVNDRYVVYNYAEDIWYYGTMGRTAWLDSGIRQYPLAATYNNNLVNHEQGVDDNETGTTVAIDSYITTSEFDIDDGHNFGFIWRIIPDITFRGSTATSPQATMTLLPLQNSGSGYNTPPSVGGEAFADVTRTSVVPIEQFTGQVYIRVRGRQMAFKVQCNQLGATWQLGSPRIDIRNDGRR